MPEIEADQLTQAVERMHGGSRAYAWSSPIGGSTKRRFFAVVRQPPVDSPQAAVRAAIIAEQKGEV
jgi:hypothetical protein